MLKYQLDSLEGLDPAVSAMYESKDGKHVLKVEGIPQGEDVAGLKAKVEELLNEKKAAAQKAREAEAETKRIAEEAARKSGDVEALEKSWQEKLAKREQELTADRDGLSSQIKALTVGRAATDLSSELAVPGSAKALLPHIERRLSMDVRDGQAVVTVLDANGKPSAATLDELKAEIASDPVFAPLIAASKATGGGAGGAKPGSGAGGGASNMGGTRKERAQAIKSKFPELNQR